ncbi:MAG TPA: hypothetical protein PKI11_14405 [Candidatus Hydrogenedentes bacterium]|nr:hypothetical protein [Candidatus Hydrogenedentota bacterium]HNT88621.1 hypothetical protein [Candidatus Hydrogenedentota bacterium]
MKRKRFTEAREAGLDAGSYEDRLSRRAFLGAAGGAALTMRAWAATSGASSTATPPKAAETYATQAKGIRILPGQWRPHYPWEHIAWVSPPWPSQDYIWLDFPEAVFTSQGLLFLSHVNPPFPTVFSNLEPVPWERIPDGVRFERMLPNGIGFGGGVTRASDTVVALELHIRNGSPEPLADITLQTCAFLRAISEFGDYTLENKFVHVPGSGWVSMTRALELPPGAERYRVGWRISGKAVSDLPVAVVVSKETDRLMAFTWGEHTLSLVGNPRHPCVHADPQFPDLAPGDAASIHGRLIFFEGKLEEFDYLAISRSL